MPFDSEGMFSRLHSWENDRINDIDIVTDHMDEEDDNFADGLSQCFLKNGTSKMEGNFNGGNFKLINVADGALPGDAVNRSQLDKSLQDSKSLINALFCVGDIKSSLISENHDNWLICDGQEISRSEYSQLFSVIGEKFGAGNGSTTFNVPDYRGRFLRGLGGNSAADVYTLQEEKLPNITAKAELASIGDPDVEGALSNNGYKSTIPFSAGGGHSGTGDYALSFDASKSNSIYSGEHVTPENYAVNWFIKAKQEE